MENRNDDTIFDESQEPLENGVEIDSEEDEITSVRRELYILKQEIHGSYTSSFQSLVRKFRETSKRGCKGHSTIQPL